MLSGHAIGGGDPRFNCRSRLRLSALW